jgi:23S rRNA pseudouridine1911/1915/1917 synthase
MPSRCAEGADAGKRLDAWLASAEPELSRSRWQGLIRDGAVRVNRAERKPNYTLRAGDEIQWTIPPARAAAPQPEAIPLDVLFEDGDLLVVNKPPDLVVHPAPGHAGGTLVNALLHHCGDLTGIGGELRPGIVHRLDRDTSGALVVAKNDAALAGLARQFKGRTVRKEYVALVWGCPSRSRGTIRTLVGRNPYNRKKMAARPLETPDSRGARPRSFSGREAVTHYEVVQRFEGLSLVRVRIETGRTHQIRVHLAHLGHPVCGDAQYGRARAHAVVPSRQMLHAARMEFDHPRTGERMSFEAPIPADMRRVLDQAIPRGGLVEIRNSKSEARNKFQARNPQGDPR